MNSILSYIAGFVVLLLFTALVGPSVVDWNSFRTEIEQQLSAAVGRPIAVSGDINLVILPAPRFSLRDLEVGSGMPGAPLAQVGTLEGEIALVPLLRAEIDIVRVRALNFTANISRDVDGRFNWAEGSAFGLGETFDPEAISLASVLLEDGEVRYQDQKSDTSFVLTNVAGELKATSLVGPLKYDGTFSFDDEVYDVSVGIGVFGSDRAFPVNLDVSAPRVGWAASFSGLSTDATASARLDGTVKFRFGTEEAAPDDDTPSLLNVSAGLVGSSELVSLRDIEMSIAGASMKGQAEIVPNKILDITADLSGPRLQIDPLLSGFSEAGFPLNEMRIANAIAGKLDIAIADLSYGRVHGRNTKAVLRVEDGSLLVESLSVELPGDSNAELKGTVSISQGAPRFDGALDATIGDASRFAQWAGGLLRQDSADDQIVSAPMSSSSTLYVQTDLAIQPSLFQAYSLSAFSGAEGDGTTPVSGGFSYAYRSRPAIGIELNGPSLDLSAFTSVFDFEQYDASIDPTVVDMNLILDFDTLQVPGHELSDVDVSASLTEGVLSVERFSSIIDGKDVLSAVGTVSEIGPYAMGKLEGTINAALAGSFLAHIVDAEMPSTNEGALTYVLRGEEADGVHAMSLDMSGELDGSTASLVLNQKRSKSDVSAEQLDLSFSIENAIAGDLVSLLGFAPSGAVDGEASFRLQLSGTPSEEVSTNVSLNVGELSASMNGATQTVFDKPRFVGRFEASADAFESLATLIGWQGTLADLISANGQGGGFITGGDLDWAADRISLSDVEAVAGTFRASGGGSLVQTGEEASVDARVDLGRVALDSLFSGSDEEAWSAEPLEWQRLGEAEGSIVLAANEVVVSGLILQDLRAAGSLSEGVLSLTPVTADFAEGRLTMGARFEGGVDVPGIGLTFALEDANVKDASKMVFGEALADGEVTVGLQLEGRGRSLLGLVSTLTGKGSLALSEGEVRGLDLPAFRVGLDALTTIDDFDKLVEKTLQDNERRTPHGPIGGSLSVEDGVLRFSPDNVGLEGASSAMVTAFSDLVRLEVDVESELTLAGDPPMPPLSMIVSGAFKDMERRTNTRLIESAVSQALLVRDIEEAGVDDLPDVLRDLIAPSDASADLDVPLEEITPPSGGASVPLPAERPAN